MPIVTAPTAGSSLVEKALYYIQTDAAFRVAYFEKDFKAFFKFHFGWTDEAEFEDEWDNAIESRDNIIFEAFRGSRKTTKIRGYVVWCAIYKKEPYIIVQSYESKLSGEWVRNVAKMLMSDSIIADYGHVFPLLVKREDLTKSSVTSFECTTGVKIESKSLGEVLRGANDFNKDEGATRPTLLIIDDIDTSDSVKNPIIIEENWRKLNGETIGSLDQFRRRVIVLGNTIAEDGILPRFKKEHAGRKSWRIFRQPLILPDGKCVWEKVFTPQVIEQLKEEGTIAFQQNYLLIPIRAGESIIPRSAYRFAKEYPEGSRIVFGIDPAFSLKTNSDSMTLTVCAHHSVQRYIAKSYEFKGAEKNEENFCDFVQSLYKQMGCAIIRIEANNGGEIIARMLQKRNLAVEVIKASKDKITRLREQEGKFTRGEVFFLPGTEAVQDQLALFPNANHDDLVDSMVYAIGAEDEVFTGSF